MGISTTEATIEAEQHHVEGVVSNMDDYLKHKQFLYPGHSQAIDGMAPWLARQDKGDAVICGSPDAAWRIIGQLPHLPASVK